MIIKKHGREHGNCIEEFVCDNCGCEFGTEDDEYYIDLGGADLINTTIGSITYSLVCHDYYVASCPECHKIVKKVKERKNNTITTTYSGTGEAKPNTATVWE